MQLKLHMITIEDLVPQERFLRKWEWETEMNLSFIYELTAPLYDKKYGRLSIDPVREDGFPVPAWSAEAQLNFIR